MLVVKGYYNPRLINLLRIVFSQYHNSPVNAHIVTTTVYAFIYGFFGMDQTIEEYADFYFNDAWMFCREIEELTEWLISIASEWDEIEELRISELHVMIVGKMS